MKNDLYIKNGITIPEHELEISTSKSSGAGGQHVNKTETKVTVRWNIRNTNVLNTAQKERVLQKLQNKLTSEGDLIVQNSSSRSQQQNKENAFLQLAKEIRQALYIPKKRMKTKIPKAVKEARLQKKAHKSLIKKLRSKKNYE
ncbi:aminoacyl-tRNA hydrolase [Candidatus Babeliales bacterium]|nr:aminoacyl-tRNA hydrolase [Candidatus Babeliales bacterium]